MNLQSCCSTADNTEDVAVCRVLHEHTRLLGLFSWEKDSFSNRKGEYPLKHWIADCYNTLCIVKLRESKHHFYSLFLFLFSLETEGRLWATSLGQCSGQWALTADISLLETLNKHFHTHHFLPTSFRWAWLLCMEHFAPHSQVLDFSPGTWLNVCILFQDANGRVKLPITVTHLSQNVIRKG